MLYFSLELLRLAAKSDAGTVSWVETTPRCANPLCADRSVRGAHPTYDQRDRVNSALAQLVSMGFFSKEADQFRITLVGKFFANAYNLLDRPG